MKNQIGVCEWSLPVNGPGAVILASKAGFTGLQLGDLGGIEQGYPMNAPAVQEAYQGLSKEYNVSLQSLHPYALQRQGTMLYPVNTPKGEQGRRDLEKCIDVCAAMGIPNVMVSSFFATLIRNEYDFAAFLDQLTHACRYGEDHGVKITYESVLSPKKILRMLESCNSKNIALCYDILNPLRWGTGEPLEEIPTLMPYIDHFHVKDAPDDLRGYALVGEGCCHIGKTAELIKALGYTGWLISENYYSTLSEALDVDFVEAARRDISNIRKLF